VPPLTLAHRPIALKRLANGVCNCLLVNRQSRSRTRMNPAARPLLAISLLLAGRSLAFGQAGSTGGSIGKVDKSVSGAESPAEPRAPPKARSKDRLSKTQCPDIEGVWNSSSPSSVSENIRQAGCSYSATLTTLLFNHAINGKYLGDSNYSLTMARTNRATGCTTVMYGRMTSVSGAGFQTIISHTDGKCDLPASFTETRRWTR